MLWYKMFAIVLFSIVIFVNLTEITTSCIGYTVTVDSVKYCSDTNVVKIENGDAVLTADCLLILKGCVIYDAMEQAKIHYAAKKLFFPTVEGVLDYCAIVENQMNDTNIFTEPFKNIVLDLVTEYLAPQKCPIEAGKICATDDKYIDIKKYEKYLGFMVGNTNIKADVDHGNGKKSCFDINTTILKGAV